MCAGHEALQALEKGSLMRKKWVGTTSAEAANQSQKTERLIRCRVENNRVVLHYHHQVRSRSLRGGGLWPGFGVSASGLKPMNVVTCAAPVHEQVVGWLLCAKKDDGLQLPFGSAP